VPIKITNLRGYGILGSLKTKNYYTTSELCINYMK